MEKENILIKFQDITIYFFIGSFLGWLLEIAYAFSVYGAFVDRGFLIGPLCPIYRLRNSYDGVNYRMD